MRLIDLIETYAYRTSKDLICKKEKINGNNTITRQICLTMIILKNNITQIGQKFLNIRIEY